MQKNNFIDFHHFSIAFFVLLYVWSRDNCYRPEIHLIEPGIRVTMPGIIIMS